MRKLLSRLWPTWPGLALPGFWVAYTLYALVEGRLGSWPAVLVALWKAFTSTLVNL